MKTKKRSILPYLTISLFFLLTLTNAFAPVGIASTAHAATYYVDATGGNDSWNGLSPETAWKTIHKVNGMNFSPGDSILFKRGEIWREQLDVRSSGEEGNPITFGAYGEVITGWSLYDEEKNIYVANVASEVTQLFVDGKRQTLARWPNSGWQNIDADSADKTSLYSESLTQPSGYWAGATIVVKIYPYKVEERIITGNMQSTNMVTWGKDISRNPKEDYGFYIEGKLEEIDIPSEWCYSGGRVYLCMEEGNYPDNHLIEGSVRDYGVKIRWPARQYVNIEGFSIKYVNKHGIFVQNCDYIEVKDNIISFPKGMGILADIYPSFLHGHICIDSNCVNFTKGDGIRMNGINQGEVVNNEVTDIASDVMSPRYAFGIIVAAKNFTISGNKINRASYTGIRIGFAENVIISDNEISNCLLFLYDGGGIYTGHEKTNLLIKHNLVRDIIGNAEGTPASEPSDVIGIYLDEKSSGVTVEGNIVFNCGTTGMLLHNAHNNTIVNNVFYNNHKRSVHLSEGYQQDYMHDNDFYNNILFATGAEELTWLEASAFSSSGTMGTYNNNLHYNPNFENTIKYKRGSTQYYTLEQWRTVLGQDEYSIAADPLFVDASNHDFHLQPFSPCIDRGIDVGLTEDFEGNPVDSAPDIGAYEY